MGRFLRPVTGALLVALSIGIAVLVNFGLVLPYLHARYDQGALVHESNVQLYKEPCCPGQTEFRRYGRFHIASDSWQVIQVSMVKGSQARVDMYYSSTDNGIETWAAHGYANTTQSGFVESKQNFFVHKFFNVSGYYALVVSNVYSSGTPYSNGSYPIQPIAVDVFWLVS